MFEELARPVSGSADLDRIVKLPRRRVTTKNYVEVVTNAFRNRKEIDPKHPYQLNPTQAWALFEISRAGGALGAIGVGFGKTGLGILAPLSLPGCRSCVLLLPASLRDSFSLHYHSWSHNFRVPNLDGYGNLDPNLPTIYPVSYDTLSRAGAVGLLEKLAPDLVIADEAHCLRDRRSTRTWRVLNYFKQHPSTRFCGWSGTLTSKSIKDYAHLSALALRHGSPLPIHTATVEEWARALDASTNSIPAPAGALVVFDMGRGVRDGFCQRVNDTLGFVTTSEASVSASIYFLERKVETPKAVEDSLCKLRDTAERPDGEQLVEASQVYRCARELASGFYYKWVFPRKEARPLIDEWLQIRKEWHKELREKLKYRTLGMDSPLLLCRAAIRSSNGYEGELPVWESEWFDRWLDIKNKVRPETEAVWISDYVLEDLEKDKKEKRIVWYEHDTFGDRLRGFGFRVFDSSSSGDAVESCETSFAANIRTHGTGRNLQKHHSLNVIANYPSAHAAWEQLIGRTHRQGQRADEVIFSVYRHTPELRDAFSRARVYARYQSETLGIPMKLLQASYAFGPDTGVVLEE